MNLNDAARELIGSGTDATLVTLNPDGSPQLTVVWMALESTPDGDELIAVGRGFQGHPHDGQLRAAVGVERDQRCVGAGSDELAGGVVEVHIFVLPHPGANPSRYANDER